jgi:hypothetical protein
MDLPPKIIGTKLKELLQTQKGRFDVCKDDEIDTIALKEIKFQLHIRKHKVDSQNFKDACKEHNLSTNKDMLDTSCRRLLKFLINEGELIGFCLQFKESESMFKDPFWVCICLMHLIMRVSEKLMTRLLQHAINLDSNRGKTIKQNIEFLINMKLSNINISKSNESNASSDNQQADDHSRQTYLNLESMERRVNAEDSGDDVNYDFRLPTDGTKKVSDFKISYVRMLKVLTIIDDIIDVCELERDVAVNYKNIFQSWSVLRQELLREDSFSEDDLDSLDENIFKFRKLLFHMFDFSIVTNYIHIIISGHLIEMIRHFGNIAIFSGIGFECLVGRVRSYFHKRTSKGGNKGRNEFRSKSNHASNIGAMMLRKFARQIDCLSKSDGQYIHMLYSRGHLVNKDQRYL